MIGNLLKLFEPFKLALTIAAILFVSVPAVYYPTLWLTEARVTKERNDYWTGLMKTEKAKAEAALEARAQVLREQLDQLRVDDARDAASAQADLEAIARRLSSQNLGAGVCWTADIVNGGAQ